MPVSNTSFRKALLKTISPEMAELVQFAANQDVGEAIVQLLYVAARHGLMCIPLHDTDDPVIGIFTEAEPPEYLIRLNLKWQNNTVQAVIDHQALIRHYNVTITDINRSLSDFQQFHITSREIIEFADKFDALLDRFPRRQPVPKPTALGRPVDSTIDKPQRSNRPPQVNQQQAEVNRRSLPLDIKWALTIADQHLIGDLVAKICLGAQRHDLGLSTYKETIGISPYSISDGSTYLMRIRLVPEDQAVKIYLHPETLTLRFKVREADVVNTLGPRGWLYLEPDQVDEFVDDLHSLFK
jgi:hypothetical protein